jgi:hypothetical protein
VSVKKISLFDDQREELEIFSETYSVFSFLSFSGGGPIHRSGYFFQM